LQGLLLMVLMVLTPGPNMIDLILRSICPGRSVGVTSLLGVLGVPDVLGALGGFLVHLFAAAVGLTARLPAALVVPLAAEQRKAPRASAPTRPGFRLPHEGDVKQSPELLRRLLRAKDRMDGASQEAWPIGRLAQVSAVSTAHFARSFKQAFGVPPHRYLLTRRIERATALLRDTDLPITEIAFQTGWHSLGTFGRIFRDVTGLNPGAFRARQRRAPHEREQVPECIERAAHRPDLKSAVSEKRRAQTVGTTELVSTEVPWLKV
jgi:AraC-like DNA-binding protein